MKNKKKLEKKYAYNINSTSNKNGYKNISFNKLKRNFYEDLLNSDLSIRKKRNLLSEVKNNSIKESVYCNKEIPKSWKTILGYSNEVYKAIDQDPEFAYYIGTSNDEKKVNNFYETKLKNVITTEDKSKKIFLNLDGIDKYIKDNNNTERNINEKNEKNTILEKTNNTISYADIKIDTNKRTDSPTKLKPVHLTQTNYHWGMNDNNILNDKLISSKLDEYRTVYDMDKFMNEIRQKRRKEGKDKELLNYVPDFITERKNNYREILKIKAQSNKEYVLKNSIYSNLLPEKDNQTLNNKKNNHRNLSLPIIKKLKNKSVKTSPIFLNVPDEFESPMEITNPKIKRDLELINYFGPRYMNCHVCRKRNFEFYQNSEPNQTLLLLNYLKKVKLNDVKPKSRGQHKA